MDGGAGGQQRIPEAYQMQENAMQEASMGGMRMSGPAAASPHVGGVGSIMQVTQTRRTIFPGTGMMRHVGQSMDYPQQPAEMLQLHTYLRCNTETLLSDRQHYREEVQQQKVMLEQNEAEIRRLKFDIQHERSFTSHLQDKVDFFVFLSILHNRYLLRLLLIRLMLLLHLQTMLFLQLHHLFF